MEFQACNIGQKGYWRSNPWWLYISKWTSHHGLSVCKVSCFYQKVHNSVIFYENAAQLTGISTGVLVSCIVMPLFVSLGLPLVDTNLSMLAIPEFKGKWNGNAQDLTWVYYAPKFVHYAFWDFPNFLPIILIYMLSIERLHG